MGYLVDKLEICNDALLATGNDPITAIEDGSEAQIVVFNFFHRALRKVLAAHDWKFALNIAEMTRLGASAYPGFSDVYVLPPDCLMLREAWDDRDAALIQPIDARTISEDGINLPSMDFRLINGHVHCIAPAGASCLYVQNPAYQTTVNSPTIGYGFREALTTEIETLLMRGYNEDLEGAAAVKMLAKEALIDAREQDSSPEPRRILFRSSMLEKRRRRRNAWGYVW